MNRIQNKRQFDLEDRTFEMKNAKKSKVVLAI
jgi:hypothetical protein